MQAIHLIAKSLLIVTAGDGRFTNRACIDWTCWTYWLVLDSLERILAGKYRIPLGFVASIL